MNADIPGAIVVPAHPVNYWRPENHGGVPNRPRALFLHTPEEPADDVEVTPHYFARENFNADGSRRLASTHYYQDNDGDLYQMVPENCAAIANGLDGKPWPSWADQSTSLNWQSLSLEIEGYARNIHLTCPRGSKQWNGIVRWVESRTRKYSFPLDRAHVMGHYQVSTSRTDPGRLDINAIVADAIDLRNQEDDMGMTPAELERLRRLEARQALDEKVIPKLAADIAAWQATAEAVVGKLARDIATDADLAMLQDLNGRIDAAAKALAGD